MLRTSVDSTSAGPIGWDYELCPGPFGRRSGPSRWVRRCSASGPGAGCSSSTCRSWPQGLGCLWLLRFSRRSDTRQGGPGRPRKPEPGCRVRRRHLLCLAAASTRVPSRSRRDSRALRRPAATCLLVEPDERPSSRSRSGASSGRGRSRRRRLYVMGSYLVHYTLFISIPFFVKEVHGGS